MNRSVFLKSSLLLFAWICTLQVFPQRLSVEEALKMDINHSGYIFEGTALRQIPCYGDANGQGFYTAYIVQIYRVLKGNLACGTVELVFRGGMRTIWDTIDGKPVQVRRGMDPGHHGPVGMNIGSSGMIFCSANNLPSSGEKTSNAVSPFVFRIIGYYTGFAPYNKLVEISQAMKYDHIKDFYHLMKKTGKLKMTTCDKTVFMRSKSTDRHEYRMKTDAAYRHETDSIDIAYKAYKQQRIKEARAKKR